MRGKRHPRSVTEQVSKNQTHHRGIQSEDGEGKDRVQDAQQDPHADGLRPATFLQDTVLYHGAPVLLFTSRVFLSFFYCCGTAERALRPRHCNHAFSDITHSAPTEGSAEEKKSFETGGNIQIFQFQQAAGEALQPCDCTSIYLPVLNAL